MNIEVVPRFIINGQTYTADELPEGKAKEYVLQRVEKAMAQLSFEKKHTA